MIKQAIFGALGAVSLALPGVSAAQAYPDRDYGHDYGYTQAPYNADRADRDGYQGDAYRGDYESGRYDGVSRFGGYPEFRGIEQHIRSEIFEGLRNDDLDRDGAQDLLVQLRQVKLMQTREYQRHGWRLPDDDRYRIRSAYERLDREVDRIRQEPEG